jgi:hypothetical protein
LLVSDCRSVDSSPTARSGQQTRQDRPDRWSEIRTVDLPTQDRNLVSQHKDLDLFGPLAAQRKHDQLHDLIQEPTHGIMCYCRYNRAGTSTESNLVHAW